MEDPTVEQRLAAWADFVSYLLLWVVIPIAGIHPRRHLWGSTRRRNTAIACSLTINIIFSASRFFAEGIWVETGPREFLMVSIIYCSRWLWLFVGIYKSGTRSAKAFEVARALRELKMIRLGRSINKGRMELVLSRGARDRGRGREYWKHAEEGTYYDEATATYLIRRIEKDLHSSSLGHIGTVAFSDKIETDGSDGLYRTFFDLMMTADVQDQSFVQNNRLVVDYAPFLEEFRGVPADTRQAERVGATDYSELGTVARRVAADACYYIWVSDPKVRFRTRRQVRIINECLEVAVRTYFFGNDNN